MRIDVIADMVCPWCFIGKRRFEQALRTHSVPEPEEIVWRPFQIDPEMPADGMKRQAYIMAKFGDEKRAERHFGRITRTGRELGIDFRFDLIRRTPNSVKAHRLVQYAGALGRQNAVVEALFQAYFTEGVDIGLASALSDIAARAGLERGEVLDYLLTDEDTGLVTGEDARIRGFGVSGVPCIVIDGVYAVSGAQSPEIFHRVFTLAQQDQLTAVPTVGEGFTAAGVWASG